MLRELPSAAPGAAARCAEFCLRSSDDRWIEFEADGTVDAERHLQHPTHDTLPLQAD